mgnify:CR=1 FL=1
MQSLPNFVKIKFHGFVSTKDDIYSNIDLVLHFNKQEALGRIFFEALDYGIPLIGFRCGGIGEIANKIKYSDLVVDESINFNQYVLGTLSNLSIINNTDFELARKNAIQLFSTANYAKILDQFFK